MEIIRKKENEVEFYTIELTGQSGMSQSGLAILSGVSQQALSDLEKTLTSRAPSEVLKPFVGKALTLTSTFSLRKIGVLPPKVFVPWLQVAGFSAMAANHGLQVAGRLEG